jgi:hypothetical protein
MIAWVSRGPPPGSRTSTGLSVTVGRRRRRVSDRPRPSAATVGHAPPPGEAGAYRPRLVARQSNDNDGVGVRLEVVPPRRMTEATYIVAAFVGGAAR